MGDVARFADHSPAVREREAVEGQRRALLGPVRGRRLSAGDVLDIVLGVFLVLVIGFLVIGVAAISFLFWRLVTL